MQKFLLLAVVVAFAAVGLTGACYALGGNEAIQPGGSGEQITLTTYYPSPYGVYKTLRLYPNPDQPNVGIQCNNPGEMSYQNSTNIILYCKGIADQPGGTWQPLGGGNTQPVVNQPCTVSGDSGWDVNTRTLLVCSSGTWQTADTRGLGTSLTGFLTYEWMRAKHHLCDGVPWQDNIPLALARVGGCISACKTHCIEQGYTSGTMVNADDRGVICSCN